MDMTPSGGSHGNPHPTTRIHRHTWRRGGSVAARGACAAVGEAADYRIFGPEHAFVRKRVSRRFYAATARTWLDRVSHHRNRVSLVGRPPRALRPHRARFSPPHRRRLFRPGTATPPRG